MCTDDSGKNKFIACSTAVVLIVGLCLFVASFGYVSELEHCLYYDTITREVDDTPVSEPGVYFYGVQGGFVSHVQLLLLLFPGCAIASSDASLSQHNMMFTNVYHG